jgi:hypothetical protein
VVTKAGLTVVTKAGLTVHAYEDIQQFHLTIFEGVIAIST